MEQIFFSYNPINKAFVLCVKTGLFQNKTFTQKDFKHDEEIVHFSAFHLINFYVLHICIYVFR